MMQRGDAILIRGVDVDAAFNQLDGPLTLFCRIRVSLTTD